MPTPPETKPARPLTLLSVVIPARDEEGCIASTIEHLHLELSLHAVPHEIVVVDDGSTDSTWQILQGEAAKISALEQSLDHCPRAAHSRDLPIRAMELGIVH
jgi:dolichol-phosphate mannosyltransferase